MHEGLPALVHVSCFDGLCLCIGAQLAYLGHNFLFVLLLGVYKTANLGIERFIRGLNFTVLIFEKVAGSFRLLILSPCLRYGHRCRSLVEDA